MSREEIMDDLQEPQQENYELEEFINEIRKYYKTHEFKRSAINDCVSRQAAIYAVAELASSMSVCTSVDECHGMKRMQGMVVRALNDLPSTQPEIIRCRDCKHYHYTDSRIPQEQMCTCDLDGDRWSPNSYCSFAERRQDGQ